MITKIYIYFPKTILIPDSYKREINVEFGWGQS